MNWLFNPLTNRIVDHEGTIDKYIGDAIMGFWNAPLNVLDHELKSCAAALDMIDCVEVLNRERHKEAHASRPFLPFRIGIGINTGRCVVGNLGSDLRFNYSVLGDPVNVAARLEGQTKYYCVPIIIGSRTAEKAKEKFAILELDLIAVKGKTEPQTIYALLGREEIAGDIRFQELRKLWSTMLYCYRSRDWEGALEAIELCRSDRVQLWSCGPIGFIPDSDTGFPRKCSACGLGRGFCRGDEVIPRAERGFAIRSSFSRLTLDMTCLTQSDIGCAQRGPVVEAGFWRYSRRSSSRYDGPVQSPGVEIKASRSSDRPKSDSQHVRQELCER